MIKKKITQKRFYISWFIILGAYTIIALRMVFLHLYPDSAPRLQNLAAKQYNKQLQLSPYRGIIYDRRKRPLAISLQVPSLAINPKVFSPSKSQIRYLAKVLDIPTTKIISSNNKDKYFAWLKRKVSYEAAAAIKKLNIKGTHWILEPGRYYPGKSLAAPVLGAVGTDNHGLFGLERQYDHLLRGEPLNLSTLRDALGRNILFNTEAVEDRAGHHMFLSIDQVIQEIAEEELSVGLAKSRAKRGFAIVSDPHTGRILAMASQPSFDPNHLAKVVMEQTQNLATSFRFEPGSVIKPFILAAALTEQKTTIDEIHHCEKSGRLRVGRNVIHDDNPHEFLSSAEIISQSSNICIFKLAKRLGKEGTAKALRRFQLPAKKPIIPGGIKGYLSPWQKWKNIRFANISFGQGLAVTGLELIQAYSAIANGGKLVTPYLVEKIESPAGAIVFTHQANKAEEVMTIEESRTIKEVLSQVVSDGSGHRARMQHYSSAGKTGTAQKIDPQSKTYNLRIANFIGFSPTEDPHLLVFVLIDEPQEKPYYGGLWAAPVFKAITERSLSYLNVAPNIKPSV